MLTVPRWLNPPDDNTADSGFLSSTTRSGSAVVGIEIVFGGLVGVWNRLQELNMPPDSET